MLLVHGVLHLLGHDHEQGQQVRMHKPCWRADITCMMNAAPMQKLVQWNMYVPSASAQPGMFRRRTICRHSRQR